jgi:hypothetical protein
MKTVDYWLEGNIEAGGIVLIEEATKENDSLQNCLC